MYYFFSPYYEVALVLALVLLVLVAPSQFTARNTGTILYIGWVFLGNLITLINKLVWNDHARNVAPVWCDITAHFLVGLHFAVAATPIVITRRLFILSRFSPVIDTAAQRRKELIIDLSIGLGIPVVGMCLSYVVQGHRANIVQGLGCRFALYNTPLTFLLVWIWPCVFSLIASIYGILTLRAFLKRRDALEEFLNLNVSYLNADNYLRLMCFSAVQLTIAFPLGLFMILDTAINYTVYPWISWEDTHLNFDRIDSIPAIYITANAKINVGWSVMLWAIPFLSYLFFLFFGIGRERRKQYKRWLFVLLPCFGNYPPAPIPYNTNPYNPDCRTWWQKLLRRPASPPTTTNHSISLPSSCGPTDLLPVSCRNADAPHNSNYPKPISWSLLPPTAPFDVSHRRKFSVGSDLSDAQHHPEGLPDVLDIRALPARPSFALQTHQHVVLHACQSCQWTCPNCQNPRAAGAAVCRERL